MFVTDFERSRIQHVAARKASEDKDKDTDWSQGKVRIGFGLGGLFGPAQDRTP